MNTVADKNGQFLEWSDVLDYLGKDKGLFWTRVGNGQRIGQAFMNTLTPRDYERLSGSLSDCFYSDETYRVILALEYLIEN